MKNLKEVLFVFTFVIIAFTVSILGSAAFMYLASDVDNSLQHDTKAHKDAIVQLEKTDSLLTAAIERAKKRNAELDSVLAAYNKKKEQISK